MCPRPPRKRPSIPASLGPLRPELPPAWGTEEALPWAAPGARCCCPLLTWVWATISSVPGPGSPALPSQWCRQGPTLGPRTCHTEPPRAVCRPSCLRLRSTLLGRGAVSRFSSYRGPSFSPRCSQTRVGVAVLRGGVRSGQRGWWGWGLWGWEEDRARMWALGTRCRGRRGRCAALAPRAVAPTRCCVADLPARDLGVLAVPGKRVPLGDGLLALRGGFGKPRSSVPAASCAFGLLARRPTPCCHSPSFTISHVA